MRLIALTTWVREPYLFKPNSSRDREENTITPTRVSRAESGKKLTKDFTKSMTFRKLLRPTLLEPSIRIIRSTRDLQTNGNKYKELGQPHVRFDDVVSASRSLRVKYLRALCCLFIIDSHETGRQVKIWPEISTERLCQDFYNHATNSLPSEKGRNY